MNPLDWRGPEFLWLFVALMVLAFALATYLRWRLRLPAEKPPREALDLEPYEVAFLKGGEKTVAFAALGRLVREQQVEIDLDSGKLEPRPLAAPLPAVEEAVYRAVRPEVPITLAKAQEAVLPFLEPIRRQLVGLGLLVDEEDGARARWLPLLAIAPVFLLGCAKVWVGLSRDRPVTILVWLCASLLAVALLVFGRQVHRSRCGDQALELIENTSSALRYQAERGSAYLAGGDLLLALALFEVADDRLVKLRQAIHPGSSGSSDGSGSGSCGGGCGGGGCGGCGG